MKVTKTDNADGKWTETRPKRQTNCRELQCVIWIKALRAHESSNAVRSWAGNRDEGEIESC